MVPSLARAQAHESVEKAYIAAVAAEHGYERLATAHPRLRAGGVILDTAAYQNGPGPNVGKHDTVLLATVGDRLDNVLHGARAESIRCETERPDSCDIVGGGVVIFLSEPAIDGDSARVWVGLSWEHRGIAPWSVQHSWTEYILARREDGWAVVGIGQEEVT